MRALTLKQPWATAIFHLGKDVENRCWKVPEKIVGQRIAIHAGMGWDERAGELLSLRKDDVPRGALLGSVELKGFVAPGQRKHIGLTDEELKIVLSSRWAEPDSEFWWHVREPIALPEPISCKGMLGFWELPEGLLL